jgi:S-adenosylmethionine:tRNA ribosyltransferase-isomerase
MPVKSNSMEGHTMHSEYIEVEAGLIQALGKKAGPVFAVGTTSLRTLESLYWMGVKCFLDHSITLQDLALQQWEVYDELQQHAVTVAEALEALTAWMNSHQLQQLVITTQLLIAPGYKAKMVSGLITNFHQPNSTLLLLVAALLGEDWRSVYDYALQHDFRFLSFGDGCLLYMPTAEKAFQS